MATWDGTGKKSGKVVTTLLNIGLTTKFQRQGSTESILKIPFLVNIKSRTKVSVTLF